MIAKEEDSEEEITEIKMIIVGEIIIEIEETEEISKEKEAEVLKNTEAEVVAEVMKKEENIEIKVLQIQVTVDRLIAIS